MLMQLIQSPIPVRGDFLADENASTQPVLSKPFTTPTRGSLGVNATLRAIKSINQHNDYLQLRTSN